ncbi:MAG: hypothetical protein JJT99_04305 [Rhodobacteraceae bacterium]|nr:hypothetical protein [Paracoccaceae bacterium]
MFTSSAKNTSPLKKLRQSSWLKEIPDCIDTPAIGGRLARSVPIESATLDQIAFALLPLEQHRRDIGKRIMALQEVISMARRQGALGAEIAIIAASKDMEAHK